MQVRFLQCLNNLAHQGKDAKTASGGAVEEGEEVTAVEESVHVECCGPAPAATELDRDSEGTCHVQRVCLHALGCLSVTATSTFCLEVVAASASTKPASARPDKMEWLNDSIIKKLNSHKPKKVVTAGEASDPGEASSAFVQSFVKRSGIMFTNSGKHVTT